MGSSNSSIDGELTQKILDSKVKDIDILNMKIDVYQLVILEEMQNPILMRDIISNFEKNFNNYLRTMTINLNQYMNNENYVKIDNNNNNAHIINIIFDFETKKVNVVAPKNFNLKNIYMISLNKLDEGDREPFTDINNLLFTFNANDISSNFYNNRELNTLNIHDQGVIEVIRKNNVTIFNADK